MQTDNVTGCAKLYSEFGISVSASRTNLKNFDKKQHRAKVVLSPCAFYCKSFEITSRVAGHNNSEFRIKNSELNIVLCLGCEHLRVYSPGLVDKLVVGAEFLYGAVREHRDAVAELAA